MPEGDQQQGGQQQGGQQQGGQQQQTPWFTGKVDPDIIGAWQNKGWKADDPAEIAVQASKAWHEAQKFVGVPADQLLRLPKDAKDEAGWNSVWSRLGQPKEAKDYDLSSVKNADGTAIDDAFAEAIRATAFSNHVPKDAATAFAQSVVKFLDGKNQSAQTEYDSKLQTEKATLAKSWGAKHDENLLTAKQGARRLGVSPEDVTLLEKQLGYSRVMEMFRKVGAGTAEDTFVDGKAGAPKTAESAQARLNELMGDPAWAKRLTEGNAEAKREFYALTEQLTGVSAAAA